MLVKFSSILSPMPLEATVIHLLSNFFRTTFRRFRN